MTVLIVRHGETPWTREGRVQGWAAVPLTDRGRDQARAAGRYLASEHDPARVVASDVRRTKETATLVVDELGAVPLETDAGWRERHFGPQQGFSDERYDADEEPMDVGDTVAFGEDWDDLDDRVNDAWDRLDRTVDTVVVTHNGPVWRLTDRLTDDAHGVDPGEVVVVEGDAVREVVSPVERES